MPLRRPSITILRGLCDDAMSAFVDSTSLLDFDGQFSEDILDLRGQQWPLLDVPLIVSTDPSPERSEIDQELEKAFSTITDQDSDDGACWTCIHQGKTDCDGHLPECYACSDNGLLCEGYAARISWKSPDCLTANLHATSFDSETAVFRKFSRI